MRHLPATPLLRALRVSVLSLSFVCPWPCMAGDAEDAVEILSNAVKCANKPVQYRVGVDTGSQVPAIFRLSIRG
jgi:hypothetical protein